jgi:NAD(P)H-dependent FMN reductase
MRILAVSGSLSETSTNTALLRAAAECLPAGTEFTFAASIGELPFFDPAYADHLPATVAHWSAEVAGADAVLIATPEYAFSLPGVLKNALDWLVGTGDLHHKAVAVLSASSTLGGGANAQQAIGQTLRAHAAHIVATLEVPSAKQKFEAGRLIHDVTRDQLAAVLAALSASVAESYSADHDRA